jgi:predicted SAM-dependent methyltransferase
MNFTRPKSAAKAFLLAMLPASAVNIVLSPWRKFYWWRKNRIVPGRNKNIARAIVARGQPIKLELGSWTRPGREDWTFCDLGGNGDLQLDLTQPIPFPDDSVERIYSSHLLEHFSYPHPMLDLLGECHRILQRGGELRIAVPNARIFLEAYLSSKPFDVQRYCSYDVGLSLKSKIDYVNFIAYMGSDHKHLFDVENLVEVLSQAGFREVHIGEFDPSIDLEERRHESIYAVAHK